MSSYQSFQTYYACKQKFMQTLRNRLHADPHLPLRVRRSCCFCVKQPSGQTLEQFLEAHSLTPFSMPFYQKKIMKYLMTLHLDDKVYGATNYDWGHSCRETILEYAIRRKLECLPVLQQLATEFLSKKKAERKKRSLAIVSITKTKENKII
ncbi:hypothetical protein OAM67_00640 [bacterium]|nr:hypothetical protein [bacterium]